MTGVHRIAEAAEDRVDAVRQEYAPRGEHPIGSYAVLMAIYGSMVSALSVWVAKRRALPERLGGRDFLLLGVATQKLSRLVAKDAVGAALRAPFTRFAGAIGEAEVHEEVRGSGLRHAIGELVTCPFCLSVWIATILAFGLVLAPRATRFAASILAAVTVSDSLQLGYARLQRAEHES
jgi:hypothetical protein